MVGKHFEILKSSGIVNVINESLSNHESTRVDLLITARINGLLMAKDLGFGTIKPLSPPLSRLWVYHYLHKRHKELVPTIDAVFKAMQESGELEALRQQAVQQLLQKAGTQN